MHNYQYPNESTIYRKARHELLRAEIDLRRQIEKIASQRRALPLGGKIPQNFSFSSLNKKNGQPEIVNFTDLFENGLNTLIAYSFMYGKDADKPCPGCTGLTDSFHGDIKHLSKRVNFVSITHAPIEKMQIFADQRGWKDIRFLSAENNDYQKLYFGERDGNPSTMFNIFTQRSDGIYHTWGSELALVPVDGHPRHADLVWSLWNLLDLTPGGRGGDWLPSVVF